MRNVPKLRFKEFNGEWEKLNAEEIFKNISNKNHNGDLPILAVTQDKGVVYRDSLDLKINSSETGIKNYKIIESGDFVISLRSFQGGIEYSSILGISSPAYTVLKPKIEISDFFYKVYLKKESFISELNSTIEGIRDGKQISYAMFSKLKLPYTKVEEQQKIADFLSSVDKKIAITEEKLDLFKDYKKGVMQKIFNQELRFKDCEGNNYPEWEEKRLGDFIVEYNEKTTKNNQYPVLTSSRKGIFLQKDYFAGQDVASEDTTGYNIVPRGYFTYRHMSDDLIFKFNINNIVDNGIVSTLYPVFTTKNINDIFLKEKLNNGNEFKKYSLFQKQGGSRTYMYLSKLLKLKLFLPCLEEQQKIANFLSSIDEKIDNLATELENLKEFKKGLLQQMFV